MKIGLPGTLIAAALILIALFGTQVPSVVMAHSPKTGRVIDAETGQGMVGVYIVASASFYAQGLFGGSADEPLYRIVTRTDSNGEFKLPSTWSKASFALPIASPRVVWMVTAVKPGYVVVGDEDALNSWRKDGSPRLWPRSVESNPNARWQGGMVQISPIQLRNTPLTNKPALVYFWTQASLGSRAALQQTPESLDLRKVGYDAFVPYVCSLDADSVLDQYEALAYRAVARNSMAFSSNLDRMEPWTNGEKFSHSSFHAGNICAALKGEGM